jgi:hypothetical protein
MVRLERFKTRLRLAHDNPVPFSTFRPVMSTQQETLAEQAKEAQADKVLM